MDKLTEIIEKAADQLGSKKALAEHLEIHPNDLSAVLAGKRGLKPIAQDKLEVLMKLPKGSMRDASEAITDKKHKDYWLKKLEALAACLVLASVTNFVTPSPAQAAPMLQVTDLTLYIMSNCRRILSGLKKRFLQALMISRPPVSRCPLIIQVNHMPA